ncbi:MAG TPA: hypothetical protein PKD70_09400 [Saprospiraceae bacterium]|nr:hypothetical protein [Saprospiraceae bacterium]HMP14082.1 hypothetical protein [Saprospiraceae bacterium]
MATSEPTPLQAAAQGDLQQHLQDDANFTQALCVRYRLHHILQTNEAEQPSMYFCCQGDGSPTYFVSAIGSTVG